MKKPMKMFLNSEYNGFRVHIKPKTAHNIDCVSLHYDIFLVNFFRACSIYQKIKMSIQTKKKTLKTYFKRNNIRGCENVTEANADSFS